MKTMHEDATAKTPTVTLIVATVERTTELRALFDSFANQLFKDFEVIIVDQNVDDRLDPYVDYGMALGLDIRHIRHRPANLSTARNVGIAAARGQWIGFPDDDCWYECDLLKQLEHRFCCPDPLSGAAVQWVDEGLPRRMSPALSWKLSSRFRDMPVASFQLFFHRRLFEKIGDFDSRLGVGLYFGAGEETDLVLRALRAGALITFEPAAKVHHPVKQPQPTQAARAAMRSRQRGAGALWAKHQLSAWVVVRGLLAPLMRPLLTLSFGHPLALGFEIMRGRVDGLRAWQRLRRGEEAGLSPSEAA